MKRTKWPHLRNAPITEAIVDIRVSPSPDLHLDALNGIHALVAAEYPRSEPRQQISGTFELRSGRAMRQEFSNEGTVGYFFRSADDRRIFQARKDGFTFNQLEPYETWGKLRAEAFRLWELYVRAAKPRAVDRVAVRYINNLRLPFPIADFNDYLTAPPEVPRRLPQALQSFLTRMVIADPDRNASIILIQMLEPGARVEKVPVILDIDVFTAWPGNLDSTAIWTHLDILRTIKNESFFGSLTPKAIELYR